MTGLSPAEVVTNATAVQNELVFISNGEAGVYAAEGSQSFATSPSETAQTITMLGRLNFGTLQSVNHVAAGSGYPVVAAGLGGLTIVQVI